MEDLPDDVVCKVLSCLTDTRSLAHFALASRRCSDMVVRADLVRTTGGLSLPHGFKHCISCFMCKGIIPMPADPGIVLHQCPHHTYKHPVWSDSDILLYRGTTNHLPQPTPYPAKDIIHRVPLPVFRPHSQKPESPAS